MTNRLKILLSMLVVILSLNLFGSSSIAEASTLKPTNPTLIEAIEAGEIEGTIDEQAGTVSLVIAYKKKTEVTIGGKFINTYYDYKYKSYPSGNSYTPTTKWKDIATWRDRLGHVGRLQATISYKVAN